jgi:hypothetical protein
MLQRFAPDRERVGDGLAPFGGVDDIDDLAVLDQVDDVRAAFQHLVDALAGSPCSCRKLAGARRWRPA